MFYTSVDIKCVEKLYTSVENFMYTCVYKSSTVVYTEVCRFLLH